MKKTAALLLALLLALAAAPALAGSTERPAPPPQPLPAHPDLAVPEYLMVAAGAVLNWGYHPIGVHLADRLGDATWCRSTQNGEQRVPWGLWRDILTYIEGANIHDLDDGFLALRVQTVMAWKSEVGFCTR